MAHNEVITRATCGRCSQTKEWPGTEEGLPQGEEKSYKCPSCGRDKLAPALQGCPLRTHYLKRP